MENSFEIHNYLINPGHPLTVAVIGAGGTGSFVMGDLVALDHYLKASGRPGLQVTLYDDDVVTEANIGRQNFSSSDIGEYKSIALVEKYNRYAGLNWDAFTDKVDEETELCYNIVISCVDTIEARKKIIKNFNLVHKIGDLHKKFLLIDCGNGYDFGQVIVTRFNGKDKTFIDHFPKIKENKQTHSCSVLESLGKQNLFINKFIANLAVNWLYEGIRNTQQTNLGYFFNFNNLIPIQPWN
jgi:PRTRC genetic system ThiF family protein